MCKYMYVCIVVVCMYICIHVYVDIYFYVNIYIHGHYIYIYTLLQNVYTLSYVYDLSWLSAVQSVEMVVWICTYIHLIHMYLHKYFLICI